MKISKILIGIDYSEYSRNAAEYGFDLARAYKATVGLVHIVEPVIFPTDTTDSLFGTSVDSNVISQELEIDQIQNNQSDTILETIERDLGEGIEVIKYTEFGITADGIINCSKEFGADLIVIGTHKRSGLDRLLLGSVAEHVVRSSTVPVLVVPFEEE